jgi:hypothetical protein
MSGNLTWRRDGAEWILLAGRRRFGRVTGRNGTCRDALDRAPRGRLSDMANLAWAKNAVLVAAERELDWEARHPTAIDPTKCQENEGVFGAPSSLVRQNAKAGVGQPAAAAAA